MASTTTTPQVTGWVGWVGFAALVMAVSGFLHIIYGFAGLFAQDWYANLSQGTLIFSLTEWGWAMLAIGALLLLASSLLFVGNMLGRIIGTILVVASLLANMMLIEATPIWSLIAITADILIFYAIVFHGDEMKQPESTSTGFDDPV